MTYSGTEPETKLCSPGDKTHGQDKIIYLFMLRSDTERAALLPSATILDEAQDGRRENVPVAGPTTRWTCSLGSWEVFWSTLVCAREAGTGG